MMEEHENKKLLTGIILALAALATVVLQVPKSPNKNILITPIDATQQTNEVSRQFPPIEIEADSAVVFDINKNIFIYQKNADKVRPLASLTKIMTAVVAKNELALSDFEKTEFDKMLLSSSNVSASNLASVAGLKISSLLQRNYEGSFVSEMNKMAQSLGLKNTSFKNPTGLDVGTEPGAVGTAREIAKLIEYSIDKNIPGFDSTRHTQKNIWGESATNTNTSVGRLPNVIFSKTGFTDLAGGNLATVIDPGLNRPVIIVLLGSSEQGRFTDMEKLAQATLDFFSSADKIRI